MSEARDGETDTPLFRRLQQDERVAHARDEGGAVIFTFTLGNSADDEQALLDALQAGGYDVDREDEVVTVTRGEADA